MTIHKSRAHPTRESEAAHSPPLPPVEDRYRLLVENATEYGVIGLHLDGTVFEWNSGASRIFGWTAEEARGKPFSVLFTHEDVEKGAPETELQKARKTGRSDDERWHVRKTGELFYASGVTTLLTDDNGGARGFAKVVRDLTTRKLAEKEQEALRQQLAEAQKTAVEVTSLQNYLLSSLTQELRTPLTTIIGYSEMLFEELTELHLARPASDVHHIRQSAEGLLRVMNDILDLSAIQTGQMELHYEKFNAAEMLEELISSVQSAAEHNGTTATITCNHSSDIVADELRLRQILLNLLNNAVRFTRDGTVELRCLRSDEGGHWILFQVSDTGPGLSPDTLTMLHAPFEELLPPPGRGTSRTNLGLAISRRYCELMGGQISVETKTGRGTTFTVKLPISPPS